MKRIISLILVLALCLPMTAALAESLHTYRILEMEHFTLELAPGEQAERFTRVNGQTCLRITRPEDTSSGYPVQLEAVWEESMPGFDELRPEIAQPVCQAIMDRDIQTLRDEGAQVSREQLLIANLLEDSRPYRLMMVYGCVADWSQNGYGLKTELYVMKLLTADSHFGAYTFTVRADNLTVITQEFSGLLDSLEWRTLIDTAKPAEAASVSTHSTPDPALIAQFGPQTTPAAPVTENGEPFSYDGGDAQATPLPTIPVITMEPTPVVTATPKPTKPLQYDRFVIDADDTVVRGSTEKYNAVLFLSARPNAKDPSIAFHALWMQKGYDFESMNSMPRQAAMSPIQEAVQRVTKKSFNPETRRVLRSGMDELSGQPAFVFECSFTDKNGNVNFVMKLVCVSTPEIGTYVFVGTASSEEDLAAWVDPYYFDCIHWQE